MMVLVKKHDRKTPSGDTTSVKRHHRSKSTKRVAYPQRTEKQIAESIRRQIGNSTLNSLEASEYRHGKDSKGNVFVQFRVYNGNSRIRVTHDRKHGSYTVDQYRPDKPVLTKVKSIKGVYLANLTESIHLVM